MARKRVIGCMTNPTPKEAAELMNTINSGDFGTWGGNVTETIYDIQEKFTRQERIEFVEHYLALERVKILDFLLEKK